MSTHKVITHKYPSLCVGWDVLGNSIEIRKWVSWFLQTVHHHVVLHVTPSNMNRFHPTVSNEEEEEGEE